MCVWYVNMVLLFRLLVYRCWMLCMVCVGLLLVMMCVCGLMVGVSDVYEIMILDVGLLFYVR